jgi:hypothetical protein
VEEEERGADSMLAEVETQLEAMLDVGTEGGVTAEHLRRMKMIARISTKPDNRVLLSANQTQRSIQPTEVPSSMNKPFDNLGSSTHIAQMKTRPKSAPLRSSSQPRAAELLKTVYTAAPFAMNDPSPLKENRQLSPKRILEGINKQSPMKVTKDTTIRGRRDSAEGRTMSSRIDKSVTREKSERKLKRRSMSSSRRIALEELDAFNPLKLF